VNDAIHNEIGNAKSCLIIDKVRDESMNEHIAIVLRFIDKNDFVQGHFFEFVYVFDTVASTLKMYIFCIV
jgi:hypothetical protein